jgi:cell division septation protein DedD
MSLLVALAIVVLVDVVCNGPLAGARLGDVDAPPDVPQPHDAPVHRKVTP